jgi:hypothetical protein
MNVLASTGFPHVARERTMPRGMSAAARSWWIPRSAVADRPCPPSQPLETALAAEEGLRTMAEVNGSTRGGRP